MGKAWRDAGSWAGAGWWWRGGCEAGGVVVVDDYAHNGDKVAAVVRTGAALAHAARGLVPGDGG